MSREIVFATNNQHKLEEIRHLLGKRYEIRGLQDIGCAEDIPEPFDTLEENARAKAEYIFGKYGIPCFADDTGLETEALGGEPGVLSARYAGEAKDPAANMEKLLSRLEGASNRRARFRTVIAYAIPGETLLFEGIVNGQLLEERRGNMGFGYDPIFVPEGFSLTFAEMPLQEKNLLSHRARAMQQFIHFLENDPSGKSTY